MAVGVAPSGAIPLRAVTGRSPGVSSSPFPTTGTTAAAPRSTSSPPTRMPRAARAGGRTARRGGRATRMHRSARMSAGWAKSSSETRPSAARSWAVTSGAPSRLSTARCGTGGGSSGRMRARKAAKSASLPVSRGEPRAISLRRSVAASVRTQTSRTGGPPSSSTHRAQRSASWIAVVKGPVTSTGQPCARISRAHGGEPGVLVHLDVGVVPVAFALARRTARRGERGGHEAAVHRVLVQQRGHRVEQREQPLGHRGLARPRRPRDHPRLRRPHPPSVPHRPHSTAAALGGGRPRGW